MPFQLWQKIVGPEWWQGVFLKMDKILGGWVSENRPDKNSNSNFLANVPIDFEVFFREWVQKLKNYYFYSGWNVFLNCSRFALTKPRILDCWKIMIQAFVWSNFWGLMMSKQYGCYFLFWNIKLTFCCFYWASLAKKLTF